MNPPPSRTKKYLPRILVSLFFGLMLTTVGIAFFPVMGRVAEPMICPGRLEIRSNRFFVPPNTKGVGRNFYCQPNNKVDAPVFFLSWLIYSLFILLAYQGYRLFKK